MKNFNPRTLGLSLAFILALVMVGCASKEKQTPKMAPEKPVVKAVTPPAAQTPAPEVKKDVLPPAPKQTATATATVTLQVAPAEPTAATAPEATNSTPAAPADTGAVLQQAVANTALAKSFDADIILNVDMMQMKMNFSFNMKKFENTYYISGEMMGMNIQTYSDGKTTVYKDLATQEWKTAQNDQDDLKSIFEKMTGKSYLNYIKDAKYLGTENVGEAPCQVIEALVDPDNINNIMSSESIPMMQMGAIKISKITMKIYAGVNDSLIHKINIVLDANLNPEILGLNAGQEEENETDIEDEEAPQDPANPPADKEKAQMKPIDTKVSYQMEIIYRDYNKLAPIAIPAEVQDVLNKATGSAPETVPPVAPAPKTEGTEKIPAPEKK